MLHPQFLFGFSVEDDLSSVLDELFDAGLGSVVVHHVHSLGCMGHLN